MLALLSAVALSALSALSQAPRDFAFAEKTSESTVRLVVATRRLALNEPCLHETLGLSPELIGGETRLQLNGAIAIFLGPRRVGGGKITDFQVTRDDEGSCVAIATARLDSKLPQLTLGDVLWASALPRTSATRQPAARQVAERAIAALGTRLGDCSHGERVVRGVTGGAFVGLRCEKGSALVLVPAKGVPQLSVVEEERFTLRDVLDPTARRSHDLVLARQRGGTARLELWRVKGGRGERLCFGAASEE